MPVARATNTGWSGCIDPAGRILGSVHDDSGRELFVEGVALCDLPLSGTADPDGGARGARAGAYLRWGDWFAYLSFIGAGACLARSRRA